MKLHKRLSKKNIIALTIITTILLSGTAYWRCKTNHHKYFIAFVERGQRLDFDLLHELALNALKRELNNETKTLEFELKIYNNEGNPQKSRQIYEEISGNERIVAVIDNTWGKDIQAAAGLIRELNIPVIAINADKQSIDYSDNVVFLGSDDHVPENVVAFTQKILGTKKAIFITEKSYAATIVFERQFKNSGIDITRFTVPSEVFAPGDWDRLVKDFDLKLREMLKTVKTPCVVLNVHAAWGSEIINHLDKNYKGINIIGGPYIANWSKSKQFGQNDNGNKLILLTNPSDTVNTKVANALHAISKQEGGEVANIPQAPMYVKRCLDAFSLIRGILYSQNPEKPATRISRIDFINFFNSKLKSKSYVGKYDLYTFDENLVLMEQKTFEQNFRGESSSYPKQLNSYSDVIPNINVGMKIINISNVDIQNRTFHADFLYWLKYDKNYPDIKDYIHFRNERNKSEQEIPTEKNDEGLNIYKQFKVSADFSFDVDFRKYPFDTQELKIELEIVNPADKLLISFDHGSFGESRKRVREVFLNEWNTEEFYITVDNFIAASFQGDSEINNKKLHKFKTLSVRTVISRRWEGPLVTVILPLISMGLAAISLLYIRNNSFSHIGEVSVGLFISVVTYSIGFAQITPKPGVLTVADFLFYITFLTVLLAFIKVIFFNSKMASDSIIRWEAANSANIGHLFLTIYLLAISVVAFWGLS